MALTATNQHWWYVQTAPVMHNMLLTHGDAHCLQLEAIKQTKVDMQVWLGNYAIATDNGTAYNRQKEAIKEAIQTYGTDHIGGITVGNEFILE